MNMETQNSRWKELYTISAIAAILSETVIIIGIVSVFIYPYAPGSMSTESIFLLLQNDKLGGLISFDFLLVLGNLFGILIFLALYVSLKQVNESYAQRSTNTACTDAENLCYQIDLYLIFAVKNFA